MQALAAQKNLSVRTPASVRSDPALAERMLKNLVTAIEACRSAPRSSRPDAVFRPPKGQKALISFIMPHRQARERQ